MRAVAPLASVTLSIIVRIVKWPARQCQQLARIRVHDHHRPPLGFEGHRGIRQLAFRGELNALVDGEVEIVPGQGLVVTDPLRENQAPRTVAKAAQLFDVASQFGVEGILQTFFALPIGRYEPEQRRRELPARIKALGFSVDTQAFDTAFFGLIAITELPDGFGFFRADTALEPAEAPL